MDMSGLVKDMRQEEAHTKHTEYVEGCDLCEVDDYNADKFDALAGAEEEEGAFEGSRDKARMDKIFGQGMTRKA